METFHQTNAVLREAPRRVRAEIGNELNGTRAALAIHAASTPMRCRAASATAEAMFHFADRASAKKIINSRGADK